MTKEALLERMDAFVPVLVNLDEHKDWARRHNVTLHPCLLFTDETGEVWGSALEMELDAATIVARIDDTLAIMRELSAE
jgi:hypothetical protein